MSRRSRPSRRSPSAEDVPRLQGARWTVGLLSRTQGSPYRRVRGDSRHLRSFRTSIFADQAAPAGSGVIPFRWVAIQAVMSSWRSVRAVSMSANISWAMGLPPLPCRPLSLSLRICSAKCSNIRTRSQAVS